MADPTLVATVGGALSNSYITRANASLYFDTRVAAEVAEWAAAVDADKDRALISATYRLEQEEYAGVVSDRDQVLKWPRAGLTDEDARQYDDDEIPEPIERAVCELALALLKSEVTLGDSGLEGFENVQVGSLDVTPRASRQAGVLPEQVKRLLRGLWEDTGSLTRPVYRA